MSRPKAQVPSYNLHKASGQAVMRVTLPGGVRKSVYLGVFDSPESKAEYARRIQAIGTNTVTAITGPSATDLTVAELLVRFLGHADQHYRHPDGKATSSIGGFKFAAKPLKELFAFTPVSEFGPIALKMLRSRMVELGWCRRSVNAGVMAVRSIFKWGVSEELVPPDVLAGLKSVQGLQRGRSKATDPEPVAPVADANIDLVLPLVPRGVRGLILFQRFTGCRPGEAVILCVTNIDTSSTTWCYTPPAHKGAWRGKGRTIAIGPRGKKLVEECAPTDPKEPVFRTADGTAYTSCRYRRAVTRACLKAGISPWFPNMIRHTYASEARRLFGLEGAQVALGHSKADVTQMYAERDHLLAARVAAELG